MLNFSINIKSSDKYNWNYPYDVECRLLYKVQGGQFSRPVFASILQVNTNGMESTHICQHFANLGPKWLTEDMQGQSDIILETKRAWLKWKGHGAGKLGHGTTPCLKGLRETLRLF